MSRWLAILAVAALLAACSGDGDTNPAQTVVPSESEEASATRPPAERWGYNPLESTGEKDTQALFHSLPLGYRIETIVDGLERPTQIAATPDGRLLIAEQPGTVRVVQDGVLLDTPFLDLDVYLPELEGTVELGLVGIAVDPDFAEQSYVYVSFAAPDPRRTVIARVRDEGGTGVGLEELLTIDAAPECCHIGGGMTFAPDGTLFIGVGDHGRPAWAQDPTTPFGSILRINRDGSFPDDNPFGGPVYAHGLRNPYDVAIDPVSGRIFTGENGFFGQDALVEVFAGANYGWLIRPAELDDPPEVTDPLIFFHNSYGLAGMEFYRGDALPELDGSLLYCQFHSGGALHEVTFLDNGLVDREAVRAPGCMSDVTTGADGLLYYLNYAEGTLSRISRLTG